MEKILLIITYLLTYGLVSYLQINQIKWSRKSIFMGVRIPLEVRDSEDLRTIYDNYRKENILVGNILSTLFSILLYFNYESLVLIVFLPIFYILALFLIYLKYNKKVKILKDKNKWQEKFINKKVVDLNYMEEREKPKGYLSWSKHQLGLVVIELILVFYFYPTLPASIPSHWDLLGKPDKFTSKSPWIFVFIILVQFLMSLIFYFAYRSIVRSKPELNKDRMEESIAKHKKYVGVWDNFTVITALGVQILFGLIILSSLGLLKDGRLISVFSLLFTLYVIVFSIYLSIKYGQGGENYQLDDKMEYNKYYRDDDDKWILGNTLYFNRDDPAVFIEKRLGVGWTVNLARPLGMIAFLLPLVLILLSLVFLTKYI